MPDERVRNTDEAPGDSALFHDRAGKHKKWDGNENEMIDPFVHSLCNNGNWDLVDDQQIAYCGEHNVEAQRKAGGHRGQIDGHDDDQRMQLLGDRKPSIQRDDKQSRNRADGGAGG